MKEIRKLSRLGVLVVWLSAAALWIELLAIYATANSPLDGFTICLSWERSGHR